MDFPRTGQLPQFIHMYTRYAPLSWRSLGGATGPAVYTPVTTTAVYIPIVLPWPYPVNRVWWINGSTTTSTNVDFGIYGNGGGQIYHTGSTAQGTASTVQYVTPATTFILSPGQYYFALAFSGATMTSRGFGTATGAGAMATGAIFAGFLNQTSAFALPASATFARYSSASVGIPVCGITRTPSGF
jgi:hypothetical protein